MSYEYTETAKRIHVIKRRIEELRSRLDTTRPDSIQRNDEVLAESRRDENTKRNSDLEDIKAKLLGRKK